MFFVTGAEIQKKWFNLRTCFARELKAQKTKSGQAASKRRKYIYFDKLLFLMPLMQSRPTEGNVESPETDDDSFNDCASQQSAETARRARTSNARRSTPTDNSTNVTNFQNSLLALLKDDIDEDKNFALSLVPTLRSLTDDEKFEAKIDILNIFKNIKSRRLTSTSFQNMTHSYPTSSMFGIDTGASTSSSWQTHQSTPSPIQNTTQSYLSNFTPSPGDSQIIDL